MKKFASLIKKIGPSWQEYNSKLNFKKNIKKVANEFICIIDNTGKIKKDDIVSIAPVYNEKTRLVRYIEHNKKIGIDHMIFIDNSSTDNPKEIIEKYDFCSLFYTDSSYAKARSGVYWFNYLLHKYAHKHWCIFVDIDELFIFPYCDTRNIHELVEFFEMHNKKSVCSTMVDLYRSPTDNKNYYFDTCGYFYFTRGNRMFVRGGPRVRIYNNDSPDQSPTNVKYPLIKFDRDVFYRNSSHQIYPTSYCSCHLTGKILPTSVIAHYKFDEIFEKKVSEALERREHFGGAIEYKIYAKKENQYFFNEFSKVFSGWKSFVEAGLMSEGQWF